VRFPPGAISPRKSLLTIPKPISFIPQDSDFSDQLSTLPQSGGLYCLLVAGGSPHLAWSANLSRRLKRLLVANPEREAGATDRLRNRLERVDCWPTSSKLESSLLMYSLAREFFPDAYAVRLRLRMPWFVGVADTDGFPRLMVTNRGGRRQESLWGPFPSRDAAEYYEQEVLRLYPIRRCTEPLDPSPAHPGCIYGEMNQCVRPCQCGVSREGYRAEFERVSEFLHTNGKQALSTLSAAREQASENLEFEEAAQIHRRIEQVKAAISAREEFVCEIRSFQGVAVTKGISAGQVRLWPMLEGYWQEPISIEYSAEQTAPAQLDFDLKERLADAAARSSMDGDPLEHLSLFLRWYRSSWRDGAWVGFNSLSALNYRRLVREISKLAKDSVAFVAT
jgi:excinuclease ABC subunit C